MLSESTPITGRIYNALSAKDAISLDYDQKSQI